MVAYSCLVRSLRRGRPDCCRQAAAPNPSAAIMPVRVTQFFKKGLAERSRLPSELLSTKSNLTFEVLRDIIDTLGLDFGPFATKTLLIDERLVQRRNTIAHGEYLDLESNDVIELHDEILDMMD